MNTTPPVDSGADRALTRRALLGGGALLGGTALGGAVVGHAAAAHGVLNPAVGSAVGSAASGANPLSMDLMALHGQSAEPFYGAHQAGILTGQQAHGEFLGINLSPGSPRARVITLMEMLTDDAARLTQGEPTLGALEQFPAGLPSRLTITFGFGPGLFAAIGAPAKCPPMVATFPAFSSDRLLPQWGQTDLLIQLCADDPITLAYAARRIIRDVVPFGTIAWTQRGFVNARGTETDGTTSRNLMGMRDGSANEKDPRQIADVVWSRTAGDKNLSWLDGGSQVVVRRIRMDLTTWDDLETDAKEVAFGRRFADGTPLTGGAERDQIDRAKKDKDGFTIIAPNAHAGLAQPRNAGERMLRRAYNYSDGTTADGRQDEGLIFVAYQSDLATAFVPVQRRLAPVDALNTWTTHVGSAVYAVPPGAQEGSYIGATLLGR
ncbi:MAG: Dyp-type peroxidase [Austwickia sp.]|nr:Dyp-type peroxidase [Austwickia sp.]